jgi:hypothetical protein
MRSPGLPSDDRTMLFRRPIDVRPGLPNLPRQNPLTMSAPVMCERRPLVVDNEDTAMKKSINYFVVLNDGETYSSLEGCRIVGIDSKNKSANQALDDEDIEAAFDCADFSAAIEVPVSK